MRRSVPLLGAAVVVLALWLAAPALSTRPYVPRAVDFGLSVEQPAGARAATARRPWTSPVLRAPKRFDLLGLRWSAAGGEVHAHVRVRRAGGRWSRWVEAHDLADHGADAGRTRGTDPVWAGGADELQLRLARRVRGLRVHFVNATGTATAADRARTTLRRGLNAAVRFAFATPTARAAGAQPPIVRRAEWGASQCPPRSAPSYGRVDLAYVHHTVSANDYGPGQSKAMVLAVCRYHRNSNGWDDIGYNFLVDKYGVIFEGRAGGIDRPVVGAQAQGYNSVSTGISNLGTYTSVPQTQAAIDAIGRLIAWKLPLHGAPVTGRVTVTSAGGSSNRYPAGRRVTLERISGHRDTGQTACPGDALYAQLPRIREAAVAHGGGQPYGAGAVLTFQPLSTRLVFPEPARLTGRLTYDAQPVVNGAVEIQIRHSSAWRTVGHATSGGDGVWTAELPLSRRRVMRAIHRDANGPLVVSSSVAMSVVPVLDAAAARRRVAAGSRLALAGTVRPRKSRVYVSVAVRRGRRIVPVAWLRTRPRGDGRYRVLVRLRRPGLYRLRTSVASDGVTAGARSRDVYVRAVRRG
jgi:hypothetical protein